MHKHMSLFAIAVGAAALVLSGVMPAQAGGDPENSGHGGKLRTVIDGLDGPRGVDALGHGLTLVSETDGTFSLVVERRHRAAKKVELGQVPADFAPAVAAGRHGTVYILTGGAEPGSPVAAGSATLYKWRHGWSAPKVVADIAAYQATDPDPYDQEDFPEDSNPFGVQPLRDGTVLVSDAAGNDLLRVHKDGSIETVARLKTRTVKVPEGLPATDPEGNPLPPAGTPIVSEAVATSVTVGHDGYWYVGELRGFPATPGTSEIWRIKPGTVDAVCDPEKPRKGHCKRFADGLTSIVDLGAGRGSIYAVSLSKMSWLKMELGLPGAEIGGLFRISDQRRHDRSRCDTDRAARHGHRCIRELVPDQLTQPGGVDVSYDDIYLTGPVFGPGSLMKLGSHRDHR
jgi:hypothetical protein